jgi:hypothetical protein
VHFVAMPTALARAFRAGSPDANGQPAERAVSDGGGNPCRHCLRMIPQGAGMLVLAHRPFETVQPYAEVGPVFLCADDCPRGGGADLPAMLASPDYILRGYDADERIVYGTGGVVPRDRIAARAAEILADPAVAFVHVRSARNTCYQCRIQR